MPCNVDLRLLRERPVASPSVPRGHLSHLVVLMVPESGSGGPGSNIPDLTSLSAKASPPRGHSVITTHAVAAGAHDRFISPHAAH